MRSRLVLYQHLTVRSVRRVGSDVHVVIADPNGTPCGINWVFDDVAVAKQRVRIIDRWRRAATRLTYVGGDGETALVDDEHLFRIACAGSPVSRS